MNELAIHHGRSEELYMLHDKAMLQVDGSGKYEIQASLDGEHWSVHKSIAADCKQHSRTVVVELLAGVKVRVVCVSGHMEAVRYAFSEGVLPDDIIDSEHNRIVAEAARIEAEQNREAEERERVNAEASREAAEAQRVNTFETNEEERRQTFESNEATREATFETNEEARQRAFAVNEAAREATFTDNEEQRQQAFDNINIERGNIRISGYADTVAQLPTDKAIGTVYGVKDAEYTDESPKYRVYVYTSSGWVDNGLFGGISAGIVQETGDRADLVMSQKAVSEELTLRGKVFFEETFSGTGSDKILKTIHNIKGGSVLTLDGNATDHSAENQLVWIQIYANKNGNIVTLFTRDKGVEMNYPYSLEITEDLEWLNCEFRFGTDEELNLKVSSLITKGEVYRIEKDVYNNKNHSVASSNIINTSFLLPQKGSVYTDGLIRMNSGDSVRITITPESDIVPTADGGYMTVKLSREGESSAIQSHALYSLRAGESAVFTFTALEDYGNIKVGSYIKAISSDGRVNVFVEKIENKSVSAVILQKNIVGMYFTDLKTPVFSKYYDGWTVEFPANSFLRIYHSDGSTQALSVNGESYTIESLQCLVIRDNTFKVISRASTKIDDVILLQNMAGFLVGGISFYLIKDKPFAYDFIHFSSSALPTFDTSIPGKITVTLPNAKNMLFYSNEYPNISYKCSEKDVYEVPTYSKLVYKLESGLIEVYGGEIVLQEGCVTLLTFSGGAVGGLLSPFYNSSALNSKASVDAVGKVYIDKTFNGTDSTWVNIYVDNIKKGSKLTLSGNGTDHTSGTQMAWIQIYYIKDGATKTILSREKGTSLGFPYSVFIEEDISTLTCQFRIGSDEEMNLNIRDSVNISDIKDITIDSLNTKSTDIFSLNPHVDVLNKLLQAKRPSIAGVTTNLDSTKNILMLLHFSDLHGDRDNLLRIVSFKERYGDYIDDAIHTGDVVANYLEDGNVMNDIKGAEKILNVVGNHDAWRRGEDFYYATQSETYDLLMRGANPDSPFINNWGVVQDSDADSIGKCYYYKDYANAKVRMIILDCMHYDSAQNEWFVSRLGEAKDNSLSVVVVQHYPAQKGLTQTECTFNEYNKGIVGYEDYSPRIERMNDMAYNAVDAFIANGGMFVCWVEGHTHGNYIGRTPSHEGQLQVIIENAGTNDRYNSSSRIKNTKSQDAFNIISIDTEGKLIKLVRIGQDRDRFLRHLGTLCYNYSTFELISND